MKKMFFMVALAATALFASCGKGGSEDGQASLIGHWEYADGPNISYDFTTDSTGTYNLYGTATAITYTAVNDTLTIRYQNMDNAPFVLPYSVSGDTLSYIDGLGQKVNFIKK